MILGKKIHDRGETSAQAVLAVPVLLMFLLFGVQVALYFHTAQLASLAAQDAASIGASHNGGEVKAIAVAIKTIAESRANSTQLPIVEIGDGIFTVEVELDVPQVVPLLPKQVSRAASEPIEAFLLESDR